MSFVAGRHSAPVAQPATFKNLTFRQQAIFNARFGPDGRTIFFSAAQSGNEPEVFSISPESPDPRPMGLQRTALLSVSSRGELALLTSAHWVNHKFFIGTLARMPLGGGGPRELAEGVREADWSPDGAGLAVIREVAGMDRLEYPLGTVLAETAGYFSDPRFSADGQRIALFEHPFRWDDRGSVILVDLQGRKTVVSQGWASEEGLAWSADGREILFSAGAGVSDLSILAVPPGGAVRKVLESSSSLFIRDVSRDGKLLGIGQEARVGLFALAPGETSERDLSWLDWSFSWALSADGRWLLFSEESPLLGPSYSTCLRRTDGSPPVRLGDGDAGGLSPDGKLALGLVPTSPMQLMLYPTGPGEARRLDTGPITVYSSTCWFPDGTRILISGSEPGKAPRCYELPIAGGPPRAVTPEGTANGLVSPDGRFVCVEKASGEATMIVPLAGGEPRMLSYLSAGERVARWTPDGRSLLVFSRKQFPSPLDRVDVSTGHRETLRRLAPADPTGVVSVISVAVADDPASYAYSYYRERSKLVLIEGAR
jgi:Tol biopolymer transport system component